MIAPLRVGRVALQWRAGIQLSLLTPGAGVARLRYVSHLVPVVDSRYQVVEQHEVDSQVAHHVRRRRLPVVVDRPVAEDVAGHAGTDVSGSDVTVELGGPRDVGADAVLNQRSEGDRVGGRGAVVGAPAARAVVVAELGLGAQRRLALVAVGALRLALLARSRRSADTVGVVGI